MRERAKEARKALWETYNLMGYMMLRMRLRSLARKGRGAEGTGGGSGGKDTIEFGLGGESGSPDGSSWTRNARSGTSS